MRYLNSKIGRLRVFGLLEGLSLLLLVFVAVPIKYAGNNPSLVKAIGPVHGILFLMFVINALGAAAEYRWKFRKITWKVLLACLVPFGTMYVDYAILRRIHEEEEEEEEGDNH